MLVFSSVAVRTTELHEKVNHANHMVNHGQSSAFSVLHKKSSVNNQIHDLKTHSWLQTCTIKTVPCDSCNHILALLIQHIKSSHCHLQT
jgi:hypothetical protein